MIIGRQTYIGGVSRDVYQLRMDSQLLIRAFCYDVVLNSHPSYVAAISSLLMNKSMCKDGRE